MQQREKNDRKGRLGHIYRQPGRGAISSCLGTLLQILSLSKDRMITGVHVNKSAERPSRKQRRGE